MLTKEELLTLINIAGQVSAPVASKEAQVIRELINKMSKMVDGLETSSKVEKDKK